MSSGFPSSFPSSNTTGYREIGAVQKTRTNTRGYPGLFPGGLTTGYLSIGAVGKQAGDATPTAVAINQSFFSMWN